MTPLGMCFVFRTAFKKCFKYLSQTSLAVQENMCKAVHRRYEGYLEQTVFQYVLFRYKDLFILSLFNEFCSMFGKKTLIKLILAEP